MKTLTVNIEDTLAQKAITAVLDAFKLEYEIDGISPFQDETERLMANGYLSKKLNREEKIWKQEKVRLFRLKIHLLSGYN